MLRDRINRWLNRIALDDPIKRRQAFIFQIFLIGYVIVASLGLPSLLVPAATPGVLILKLSGILLVIFPVVALRWLRHGWFEPAAQLAAIGLILIQGISMIALGLRGPAVLVMFFIPITLAGLLTSRRMLLIASGLSVAIVVSIAIMQNMSPPLAGLFLHDGSVEATGTVSRTPRADPVGDIIAVAIFMLCIVLVSLLFDRFGGALREALAAALEREQELQHLRASLERQVAERTRDLAVAVTEAQAARASAEQASEHKSQFLANMSHELRTPLNSIINFTRILSAGMRGPVNEGQLDYLDRVRQSGEHLLGLINDILDLSKIEAGRMELFKEQIEIADLVQGVLSTAAGLIKGKPIELQQELAPDLPPIEADRTRVRQIMLNLLSNAAKFTDAGTIAVRVAHLGDEVVLSVSDTGIGITPEHLATIFEEFHQIEGDNNRRYEGTGLGLAICRRFVELHGGRIWVESSPGSGSTFSFSLPLAHVEPAVQHTALPALPEGTGSPILVIDDDPAAIEIVAAYLARDGYNVYGLSDSRRALEEARRTQPAAIVLDILMPHRDGWEVLADLKADPELQALPVVLYTIVDEKNMGFYLGASAYLTKPISEAQLRGTIARLIGSGATVLVIDDDADAREIVARQIERSGVYRVVTASNGREGLERIAQARPDLLILDLMMPEVDGFAVLEQLDHSPETRAIPVIVMTAKDLSVQERSFLRQRVDGLIAKGFMAPEELLHHVTALLGPAGAGVAPTANR